MNRRVAAVLASGMLLSAVPVAAMAAMALPASASTHRAAAPTTMTGTTTSVKATQVTGTTAGKMVFGIQVKASSGSVPQGTVTVTVDSSTPVLMTLKSNGRATFTHHYKPGAHTVTATYQGSTTDLTSSVTIPFTVS